MDTTSKKNKQVPTTTKPSDGTGSGTGVGETGQGLGFIKYPTKFPWYTRVHPDQWQTKGVLYGFGVDKPIPKSDDYEKSDDFDYFFFHTNPTSITISVPFAINLTPTTRGVVEEHNAVVFENIVIAGTTGIAPKLRYMQPQRARGRGALVRLEDTVAEGLNQLGIVQGGGATNNKSINDDTKPPGWGWYLGHSQLLQLSNYFKSYAEYKKKKKQNAVLKFFSLKENASWRVIPVSFEYNKAADNPFAFNYRIILKAWGKESINIEAPSSVGVSPIKTESGTQLGDIYNRISKARAMFANLQDGIKAVVSDVATFYSIVSETMMAIKEEAGVGRTLADFPQLVRNRWTQIAKDFKVKANGIRDTIANGSADQRTVNLRSSLQKLEDVATSAVEQADATNPSGVLLPTETAGTIQSRLDTNNPFNAIDGIFKHVDFLDQFPLGDEDLNDSEEALVDSTVNNIQNMTILDYDTLRKKFEEIRDAYANAKGLGDSTYNAIKNRIVPEDVQTPTKDDYLAIKAFNDMIEAIDTLSATNDLIRRRVPDPFVRAQEITEGSNITIQKSNVAYPIPFPFNGTLEGLASLYLGDANKWIEIALMNNLKPPYIDEEGFVRYFTSSGNGRSFTTSDDSNLFLGQEIFISSVTKREERRIIVRIDELGTNNYLIEVDGDEDLDEFTTTHEAQFKAFLPNTVSSSKVIYIPTGEEIGDDNEAVPNTRTIPITADLDYRQKLMGVDLGLTDDFDLAISNNGDIKLVAGYNNAVQALRIKLGVEKGQLRQHPGFGVALPVGEINQITARELKTMLERAILKDKRFAEVIDVKVEIKDSTVKVSVIVRPNDGGSDIPIMFEI